MYGKEHYFMNHLANITLVDYLSMVTGQRGNYSGFSQGKGDIFYYTKSFDEIYI